MIAMSGKSGVQPKPKRPFALDAFSLALATQFHEPMLAPKAFGCFVSSRIFYEVWNRSSSLLCDLNSASPRLALAWQKNVLKINR